MLPACHAVRSSRAPTKRWAEMHITRTLGALAFVALIGGAAFYLVSRTQFGGRDLTPRGHTSGMLAEDNAIVAEEQRPGSSVTIAQVHLVGPGYVVVHEQSGAILGSSALLPAGNSNDVQVAVIRPTTDGETLDAMLHFERNGDSTFQNSADPPIESRLGGPIVGTFTISSSAPEGGRTR